jgi:hypothetical protein
MVSILSLWLPILLSAVVVFIISSIIHMVLGYHKSDFKKIPSEDQIMEDLRKYNIPPGDYHFPRAGTMADMKSQEYLDKSNKGPVAVVTIMESGPPKMGGALFQWFLFSILIGILAAYITGQALGPGANYLSVFRFVGFTAFVSYSIAAIPQSIWYKKNWGTTFKTLLDGLIYALLTAGIFGWLWPAV